VSTRVRTDETRRERFERTGALVIKDARGEIRIDTRAGLHTEVKGHLSESLAERLREAVHERSQQSGRALAFHDWEAMTGYDPTARQLLAKMLDEGRAFFECTHILLGSSLAGMGVSIAATLLGQAVRSHTTRESWEQALMATERGN
jgi:hypothetical protein